MASVARRVGRALDLARELIPPPPPPDDAPMSDEERAWWDLFAAAADRLLATMEPHHAERVFHAIRDGTWQVDPLGFHALDLVLSSVPRGRPEWFPRPVRGWICVRSDLRAPLALPLELAEAWATAEGGQWAWQHPDDCGRCGSELPAGSFATCPLCGWPEVGRLAFSTAGHRCVGVRLDRAGRFDACPICAVDDDRWLQHRTAVDERLGVACQATPRHDDDP